jgi:uncharacterized coiled-coil protein SlyX
MIPYSDQYVQGLERRYCEKADRVEVLEIQLADKEICIFALEKLVEMYQKRIETLEAAIKGPVF